MWLIYNKNTAQPSNATANEGGTAHFTVTTSSSSGTPTYQWERSDDGGANYAPVGAGQLVQHIQHQL